MKIFYTVTITGNQHESRERATDTAPAYCCDEMYDVWGVGIGFDHEQQVVDLMGTHDEGDMEFREGNGLRFCPWCGQPIELERTGTEDKRTQACAAKLRTVSLCGSEEYCSNSPRSGYAYCGRHKHLEEGADTKKLFGIPIIEDDRLAPDEGGLYPLERTCHCEPAQLVRLVLWPVPGAQCACGAVWPLAAEPEVRG